MHHVSVQQFHEKALDPGKTVLIDVRTPSEHSEGHIPGAKNIPLDQLESQVDRLRGFETVYAHCKLGGRSSQGCEFLEKSGLANVVNVDGGFEAWKNAGFEVEKS